MEPILSPRRRRLARLPALNSRDAQDMVSLLVTAVVGSLTTGAIATLIMMSAPAHAGITGTDGAGVSARKSWLYPAPAVSGDDPAPLPVSGPPGLALPPVCTCALPPPRPD